ncbi:hypothetical protein FA10DRAFT_265864 [Acaromyces ingoldii]|uniref:PRP1 splicing factor N-terminal domain-containing protein n=1 Tax=Acaromyces ingoldii TaxID=215250 RepID=A0A316YTS4_9BASI|nr:hypothetical protein FA10DRAFT_265864 [Acaromyces ingoldii]PWN92058.1 hypothetical protein FA10DRAFT_265864 [Acaromyces ingoldii]
MASGSHNKLAFLQQAPPANYVAGLGRGASGFTTRSDIGPAREGPSAETIAAARAKRGLGPEDGDDTPSGRDRGDDDDGGERGDEEENDPNQDPENETGLFAGAVYERDDEEADRIWEGVDRQMDERRRKKREAREKEELAKFRAERPKIQAQFADLKRGLSTVSEEEWANLPEPGNLTGKRRKAASKREARDTRSFAVPDSVILGNRERGAMESSVGSDEAGGASATSDGTQSSLQGTTTSLTDIGEARNKIFSHKLDEAGESGIASTSGTSSTIDPKGYLTELSSTVTKSAAEIGDIKKARSLLDSVIKTNPKHAPGWIAAARLEEVAGKMAVARKVIAQGCEQCPKSDDVWLESARLNTLDNAKVILAQAVQHISQSVKIWLKAAELETDPNSKKRVLRKSIEYIPHSVKLWKELVNLEESPEDARILLSGAVANIPQSVDLWLALARLSSPQEARKVLNEARRAVPTSHEIWISAVRLMEQQQDAETQESTNIEKNQTSLDRIMAEAVNRLSKAGAVLSREQWLREAEQVEKEGSPKTSAAIIKATIGLDIDDEDRKTVWVEDAQSAIDKGCIDTARAILAFTLRHFPDIPSIWRLAADLEKSHGNRESLEALLEKGVENCPKAEFLWLFYAKERWATYGDVAGAREILIRAFDQNVGSEHISLEAAQLEAENGQTKAASLLLARARKEVGSERVWLKSILLERNLGHLKEAADLTKQALEKFPDTSGWKFYLVLAQLTERLESQEGGANIRAAREVLTKGCKRVPKCVPLWLEASRLEERADLTIRSRAILEKARLANPRNEQLWLEAVDVEERSGSVAQAKATLARGLQECPSSGALHARAVWLEPRQARKTRSADALKKTGDHVEVLCTVARLFWNERKIESARKWFERMSKSGGDWGDGWAWWLKFEKMHGTAESQDIVRQRCARQAPRHGRLWQRTAKDIDHPSRTTEEILNIVADQLVITT